jgi:hypothetical protein
MSSAIADAKFIRCTTHPSNLDRCKLCGGQRSAHGADWSCPPGLSQDTRAVLFVAGVVLAALGAALWILVGSLSPTLNTLAALALPAGLMLIIISIMIDSRAG